MTYLSDIRDVENLLGHSDHSEETGSKELENKREVHCDWGMGSNCIEDSAKKWLLTTS